MSSNRETELERPERVRCSLIPIDDDDPQLSVGRNMASCSSLRREEGLVPFSREMCSGFNMPGPSCSEVFSIRLPGTKRPVPQVEHHTIPTKTWKMKDPRFIRIPEMLRKKSPTRESILRDLRKYKRVTDKGTRLSLANRPSTVPSESPSFVVEHKIPVNEEDSSTPVDEDENPPAVVTGSEEAPQQPFNIIEETVIKNMLSILECPVCFEYITMPIPQCIQGHIICSNCFEKLSFCPKCRARFSESRNRAMEKVTEIIPYPCKNAAHGCSKRVYLKDKTRHELCCDFRQYQCLDLLCQWKGFRNDLFDHMLGKHPRATLLNKSQKIIVSLVANDQSSWLVFLYDEIFHITFLMEKRKRALIGMVMYLGDSEKASDYKYTFTLQKDTEPFNKLTFSRETHEETPLCEFAADPFNGFCLLQDMLQAYVDTPIQSTKDIVVRVSIDKIEEDGSGDFSNPPPPLPPPPPVPTDSSMSPIHEAPATILNPAEDPLAPPECVIQNETIPPE